MNLDDLNSMKSRAYCVFESVELIHKTCRALPISWAETRHDARSYVQRDSAGVVRKLPFCYPAHHPHLCRFTMVRCHLSILMGRDKLRISDVSRLTGLNRSTVTSLYKETSTRLDVAAIDALCNLFRCSVGELFEHVPDADRSAA